jgi:predicted nucleic acid-binding protein
MARLADLKRVYWDSCVWIAYISEEAGRAERCESLIKQAQKGDLEIWTSALTLAEVYKLKCDQEVKALAVAKDEQFESFIQQPFVMVVQIDGAIGVAARRLLRNHPPLKKPNDAIHLASAAFGNVEALYTFDSENLIPLSNKILRADLQPLIIGEPPAPFIGGDTPDMFGGTNPR